jgi:hypothetical protein
MVGGGGGGGGQADTADLLTEKGRKWCLSVRREVGCKLLLHHHHLLSSSSSSTSQWNNEKKFRAHSNSYLVPTAFAMDKYA